MPGPIKKEYWYCGDEYCGPHATREEAEKCALSRVESVEKWQCPVCKYDAATEEGARNCCVIAHLEKYIEDHRDRWPTSAIRKLQAKIEKAKEFYANQQL